VAGIAPEHGNPSIFVTPTLLGEENHRSKMRRSCVAAVSCPWLIAALVERAGAAMLGMRTDFYIRLAGS
jgi:hypothetical protein